MGDDANLSNNYPPLSFVLFPVFLKKMFKYLLQ